MALGDAMRGWTYPAIVVTSGVLALLVFAFPPVLILGFFLLFVPGLVLMAAPNVFLYAAAFWPAWIVWRLGRGTVTTAIAGVLLFIPFSVATWPAWSSGNELNALIAKETKDNFSEPAKVAPKSIGFENHSRSTVWNKCDELCQLLLLQGHVERVVYTIGKNSAEYRVMQIDGACTNAAELYLRELALAEAKKGRCIIKGETSGPVDVLVEQGKRSGAYMHYPDEEWDKLWTIEAFRVFDVKERVGRLYAPVEHHVSVNGEKAMAPFLMALGTVQGTVAIFPAVARLPVAPSGDNLPELLERRYGWNVTEMMSGRDGFEGR